ncbi:autotransporter outer membrane beta-barrel domain-containing protein, partial [Escherichia whittamii]
MKLTKHALSTLSIAILTILFTPESLAITPPINSDSNVVINNNEEVKLIASEGYDPGWEHFKSLKVGEDSNGSLLIDNLSFTTSSASIGNHAEGTITLTNHTNWQLDTPTSNIFLGTNEGSGTLYVLEGSKISGLQSIRIGEFYGDARGTLVIDGENSSVTTNIAIVGDQGTGKVSVTNGGTLTSLKQLNIGYVNAHSPLSANQSSYGEVQVADKNSTVNAPYILLGGYDPSSTSDTTGVLTVSNDAVINASLYIMVGVSSNGTGVLNIGGAQGEAAQPAGSINTPVIILGGANTSTTSIVNFNHTNANFVLTVPIDGKGQVNQVGSGTTTLSGMNNYDGNTYITKGSLRAGNDNTFSANSDYIVDSGGHLDLNGYSQALKTLALAGTATLSSYEQGHEFTPTTLTIDGNYTASDGLLVMHTVLGDDNSATDKLIVKGDTSGSTRVMVNNAGGLGADTLEGIKIVEVDGLSEGVFSKEGRIVAGPYDYNVVKSDNQNWFLTSEIPAGPYTP